jgi:hypothetical protein
MAKTSFLIVSTLFGLLFSLIGLVNLFWGNDPFFGLFLIVLSLIYYPPVQRWIKLKTGFVIPGLAKIALGAFILWASIGVGELFDKIEMIGK